jgi:hypothetical protein
VETLASKKCETVQPVYILLLSFLHKSVQLLHAKDSNFDCTFMHFYARKSRSISQQIYEISILGIFDSELERTSKSMSLEPLEFFGGNIGNWEKRVMVTWIDPLGILCWKKRVKVSVNFGNFRRFCGNS